MTSKKNVNFQYSTVPKKKIVYFWKKKKNIWYVDNCPRISNSYSLFSHFKSVQRGTRKKHTQLGKLGKHRPTPPNITFLSRFSVWTSDLKASSNRLRSTRSVFQIVVFNVNRIAIDPDEEKLGIHHRNKTLNYINKS